MIIGIRNQGEARHRYIAWTGTGNPPAGTVLQRDDGRLVTVTIAADQLHGAVPADVAPFAGSLRDEHQSVTSVSVEARRYDALLAPFPDPGARIATPGGPGIVVGRHLRDRAVTVRLDDTGDLLVVPVADLTEE